MTVLIVGGGWSGLAAAITLTQHHVPVVLVESAKQLGGRARDVSWHSKTVDNGQHLTIGAYQHMLSLLHLIGVNETDAFIRQPLDISIFDTEFEPLTLSANSRLPWPFSLAWSLLKSSGVTGLRQVVRLQRDIPHRLAQPDITVESWLSQTNQSKRFIKQLWEPLCLATLNTPISGASTHLLATVLRDSLGKTQSDADLLIPAKSLGQLFVAPAIEFINAHGGKINTSSRVQELVIEANQIRGVRMNDGSRLYADQVILAIPAHQTHRLLKDDIAYPHPTELPIVTVYLQYERHYRLPALMLGLSGTLSQWVFDRSSQDPGLISVVISGPGEHEAMTNEQLIQHVERDLHKVLSNIPTSATDAFVIREKRATFAATPLVHASRPSHKTQIDGLFLAGDFVKNDYPATIEGAMLNGITAAKEIIRMVDVTH
jgi:squalene-associated FAD-dependent desaturase